MELNKPMLCEIVQIVDGDTFTCKNLKNGVIMKIRMNEIDAPELSQPAGWEAHHHLKELLEETNYKVYITPKFFGKNNRIVADLHQTKSEADRFDVMSSLNYRMVDDGYAWSYSVGTEASGLIKNAEVFAHNASKGLWSRTKTTPVHPAQWRKEKSKMNAIASNIERLKKLDYFSKKQISTKEVSNYSYYNIDNLRKKTKRNEMKVNIGAISSIISSSTKSLSNIPSKEELDKKAEEKRNAISSNISSSILKNIIKNKSKVDENIQTKEEIQVKENKKILEERKDNHSNDSLINKIDEISFDLSDDDLDMISGLDLTEDMSKIQSNNIEEDTKKVDVTISKNKNSM